MTRPWTLCPCGERHRGPRHKPEDERSHNVMVTLPGHVYRELMARVPHGERSGFVARLVADALHDDERGWVG